MSNLSIEFPEPSSTPASGVWCQLPSSGERLVISSVRIKNASAAGIYVVRLSSSLAPAGSRVTITDVSIEQCSYGMKLERLLSPEVSNSHVTSCSVDGVHLSRCHRAQILQNRLDECRGSGVVALYSPFATIHGNHVSGSHKGGITIGGGAPNWETSHSPVISQNVVTGSGLYGITLDLTERGRPGLPVPIHAIVQDNICTDNLGSGVNVTCSSDVRLVRNDFRRNANGISLSTRDTFIAENVIVRNKKWGIAIYGRPGSPYGDHTIGVNDIHNNVLGSYYVAPGLSKSVVFEGR